MLLYSSDAPAGWNALPTPIKQKFHDIGQKGDWTAQEAYDHLVPDHLKDNPQEVQAWMDGDPSLGINDKDVSRIESGENGGEYSADNTVMEDMSVNRARGADNMSEAEYNTTVEANASDADIIETTFESTSETIPDAVTEIAAETAAGSAFEAVSDAIGFAAPPIILAMKAGRAFSNDPDEQAGAAVTVGTIASVGMFTPAAPVIAGGALIWSLWGLGQTVVTWFNQPSYR